MINDYFLAFFFIIFLRNDKPPGYFTWWRNPPGPEIEGMRWEPWTTSKSPSGSDQPTGLLCSKLRTYERNWQSDGMFSPPNSYQTKPITEWLVYTGVPQGRLTRRDETAGTMAYREESRWKFDDVNIRCASRGGGEWQPVGLSRVTNWKLLL